MRTAKWLGITLAAAVAVGGLTVVHHARAQAAAARLNPGGALLQKARARLGLTDDQTARIKTELAAEKTTLSGLLNGLHEAHTGLRTVIQKHGATEGEIRAASARVAALEADFAVERAKLYGRISPILTPAQLAQVREFQTKVDEFLDVAIYTFGERIAQ